MPGLFPGCCIKAGGAEQPAHGGTCQHPATCSEHTWSHHYYNQTNKSVLMRTQPLQRPDTLPNLPQELQQQKNLKNWSKRDIPELPLGEVEDLSCGAWESWKEVVRHGHPPRDTAPWHRSARSHAVMLLEAQSMQHPRLITTCPEASFSSVPYTMLLSSQGSGHLP